MVWLFSGTEIAESKSFCGSADTDNTTIDNTHSFI